MVGIKEKIENNVVVWMLGTLLSGFLAGIATYQGALRIMDLATVGQERLRQLEGAPAVKESSMECAMELPNYLNSSELQLIFLKIKSAFNDQDTTTLYDLVGPMGKSQVTEEVASLRMEPVFQNLGKIQKGFYVQHQFMGQQGPYKTFVLNFSVKYEKAPKGLATITVLDDGKSYQIYGIFFTAI